MVEPKVLIGAVTGEYARRSDFYDYYHLLEKPSNTFVHFSHDRSPAHGRNLIIGQALENKCTHVLLMDDDMVPKPNALKQLLEHDKDVVTGLYLSRAFPHQPLIFDVSTEQGALHSYLEEDEPRLKKIANAGLGFVLIKTHIFEVMEKPWIRLGELQSDQWCDDIGFFNRLTKAGFEMYCDMECMIGHIGSMIVWPQKNEKGEWFTGYDSSGKVSISIPQSIPIREAEFK